MQRTGSYTTTPNRNTLSSSTGYCQKLFNHPDWSTFFSKLQPTSTETNTLSLTFSKLSTLLNPIGKAHLVGSVGKGTNYTGNKEIDIVVVIEGLSGANHPAYLQKLKDIITTNITKNATKGPFSVQFQIDGIEVDLLPAAPMPSGPVRFFVGLKAEDHECMLPAGSILACQFISQQPLIYKAMVRAAKYWRDQRKWPSTNGPSRPQSCFLELIMLYAFQQEDNERVHKKLSSTSNLSALAEEESFLDAVFRKFLEVICSLSSSTLLMWTAYYSESVPHQLLQNIETRKILQPKGDGPILLEPSNPTNNMLNRISDLSVIKKAASDDLQCVSASTVDEMKLQLMEVMEQNAFLQARCDLLTSMMVLSGKCFSMSKSVTWTAAQIKNITKESPSNQIILFGPVPLLFCLALVQDPYYSRWDLTVTIKSEAKEYILLQALGFNNITLTLKFENRQNSLQATMTPGKVYCLWKCFPLSLEESLIINVSN